MLRQSFPLFYFVSFELLEIGHVLDKKSHASNPADEDMAVKHIC